jgi:hypothetical protein
MGGFTDTFEAACLNALHSATTLTGVAVEVALCTTAPTDSAAGTEVTGGSYARQACGFTTATAGTVSNTSDITFPTATADWGTVTHCELWTPGGVRWGWAALTASKLVQTNDIVKFLAGALVVTLD